MGDIPASTIALRRRGHSNCLKGRYGNVVILLSVPAVVGGRVVGAIGVSGGNAQQDHDVAVAALEAVGMSSSSQSAS